MIESLSLQNFKAFRDLRCIQIKPITVLCGTNSSGKSSILQSLLLLKQTFESQTPNQTLLLNGRLVHLGSFENVIFGKQTNERISFAFSVKVTQEDLARPQGRNLPLKYVLRDIVGEEITRDGSYVLHYEVVLGQSGKTTKRYVVNPIVVERIAFRVDRVVDGTPSQVAVVAMTRHDGATYKMSFDGVHERGTHKEKRGKSEVFAQVQFANLMPVGMSIKPPANERTAPPFYVFHMMNYAMKAIFGSMKYLGPLREEPARRYIYEDEVVETGIKGENAAYLFLSERSRKISGHHFYDDVSGKFVKHRNQKLMNAVQQWLSAMGIREFQAEPTSDIISLSMDAGTPEPTRVSIADVGFGVSQIFPIVLEGLRMDRGNTLMLEQPEIHLHPNLQMQLADYFISLALSSKRVIVETHSDHMVNRLVRRIVEDDSNELASLVGIYFIRHTANGASFEEVKVSPTRGISNWPNDFFDQNATEQERIIRACIKRSTALATMGVA